MGFRTRTKVKKMRNCNKYRYHKGAHKKNDRHYIMDSLTEGEQTYIRRVLTDWG